MSDKIEELRKFLNSCPAGQIVVQSKLIDLLESGWNQLEGNEKQGMTAEKVDRIEKVEWDPPLLTFVIERHGATVQGSSRAELHTWTVDLERGTASCDPRSGFRQLIPNDAPLKVEPIVEEIERLILNGQDDVRLFWSPDRSKVRVLVSEFISGKSEQTRQGRRKRFREALDKKLERSGWIRVPRKRDVYARN
jgi:hypothetical protein